MPSRPVDQILDSNTELMFCGPYRWTTASLKICAPSYPSILAVSGRQESWLTDRRLNLHPGKNIARMSPATKLFVRWEPDAIDVENMPVLSIETRLGTDMLVMRPTLATQRGKTNTVLLATIVVPRGRVSVECIGQGDGRSFWQRTIAAEQKHAHLNVKD